MKRRHKLRQSALASSIGFWGSSLAGGFFVVLSAVLLVFSLAQSSFTTNIRITMQDIFAPVVERVYAPIHFTANFIRDVSGLASLQEQNTLLRAENEKLREWYHRAMVLDHENKSLRDLLNMETAQAPAALSTKVIADTGSPYVKSLLIDSGRNDGVISSLAVMASDGLVGRTIDVGEKTARVLLLNDISSRIPVMVEGSGEHAILSGSNDDMPYLKHLPFEHQITQGARVVTSGQGGVFPSGLPVGRVVYGETGSDGKSRLSVSLYADTASLMYVRVLQGPDSVYIRQAP